MLIESIGTFSFVGVTSVVNTLDSHLPRLFQKTTVFLTTVDNVPFVSSFLLLWKQAMITLLPVHVIALSTSFVPKMF